MAYEVMIHVVDDASDKIIFTIHADAFPPQGAIVRWKEKCYRVEGVYFDCSYSNSETYMKVTDVGPFAWPLKEGCDAQSKT